MDSTHVPFVLFLENRLISWSHMQYLLSFFLLLIAFYASFFSRNKYPLPDPDNERTIHKISEAIHLFLPLLLMYLLIAIHDSPRYFGLSFLSEFSLFLILIAVSDFSGIIAVPYGLFTSIGALIDPFTKDQAIQLQVGISFFYLLSCLMSGILTYVLFRFISTIDFRTLAEVFYLSGLFLRDKAAALFGKKRNTLPPHTR